MREAIRHCLLLLVAAGAVLFTGLGGSRLWDRDEPRNAGCALEMAKRGDWVTPVFNGQLRTAKPVLLYWLIMSAYSLFGVSEFAARFWSAVFGVGAVLATYFIGRRLFHPRAALWSGVMLSTSLMFDVAGRAATPDSTLIFFATAALLVFVAGAFGRSEAGAAVGPRTGAGFFPARWGVAALMYALMGVAVLAKGPVGLVLPTAVVGMFLLVVRLPAAGDVAQTASWPRRVGSRLVGLLRPFAPLHFLRTCWFMRPLTAVAVVLAVAAPWYVWVGFRTDGQWLRGFFWTEHVERALRPMENHGGWLWYYPAAVLAGFFPWSVFLGPTLIDLVRRIGRRDPWSAGYILVSCWAGVYVALFSLARTKLPNYVTPAHPALALMAGCFFYHFTRGAAWAAPIWSRLAFGALAVVGATILVAVPLAAHRYLPGEEWLGLIGLAPLAGAVSCLLMLRRRMRAAAGATFTTTALCLAILLFGVAAERVNRHQKSHVLLNAIIQRLDDPQIGALGCLEPSWVFYGGRPIRELSLDPQQRAAASQQPQAARQPDPWRPNPPIDAAAFLAGGSQRCVITTGKRWQQLRPLVPREVDVLSEAPYFLKDEKLVLVGWTQLSRHAAAPGASGIR